MSTSNILIRKAGTINWTNSKPRRAGIILYNNTGLYLGVDSFSEELTDFGGEINYINEDTITGSIREYKEETLETLPQLTWFDIFSASAVLSDSIVIFLIRANSDLQPMIEDFHIRKNDYRVVELSDIRHINWEDIEKLPIYGRVRPLLLFAVQNYDWK